MIRFENLKILDAYIIYRISTHFFNQYFIKLKNQSAISNIFLTKILETKKDVS